MMAAETAEASAPSLSVSQIEDLKLASANMTGPIRRSFQAKMALKYCAGNARRAERVFGWGRETVQLGLHELRTGITCLGAQEAFCGKPLWEDRHPEAARRLWELAREHSQQDPTFRTPLSYTRLTAAQALARLRPVLEAKPQKNSGDRRHLRQHQGERRSTDGRGHDQAHQHRLQSHGQHR